MNKEYAMFTANAMSAYQSQVDIMSIFSSKRTTTPVTTDMSGFGSVTDTVDLSATGMKSYSDNWIFDQLMGVSKETIGGQYKTLGQVGEDLAADLAGFETLANQMFSMAGVNLANPITLQGDGVGNLQQVGDKHEDSEKIGKVLTSNSVMTSRFMVAAARASILHAAETNPEFTTDYNANPPETMEKYEEVLKEYMLSFQMTISSSGLETGFARPLYEKDPIPVEETTLA